MEVVIRNWINEVSPPPGWKFQHTSFQHHTSPPPLKGKLSKLSCSDVGKSLETRGVTISLPSFFSLYFCWRFFSCSVNATSVNKCCFSYDHLQNDLWLFLFFKIIIKKFAMTIHNSYYLSLPFVSWFIHHPHLQMVCFSSPFPLVKSLNFQLTSLVGNAHLVFSRRNARVY